MEVLQHAPNVYAPNVRGAWLTDRTMLDHRNTTNLCRTTQPLEQQLLALCSDYTVTIIAVVPLVEHNTVQYCLCRLE